MTVLHQFEDATQQDDAYQTGMWVFLASEVMFFGALICGYVVYRLLYPAAFLAGSGHMDLVAGTVNTVILLTSSLTMALAIHANHEHRPVAGWLWATTVMGLAFLAIKGYEYYEKFQEHLVPGPAFDQAHFPPGAQLFFLLYFCLTGLHAIHLTLGCCMVGTLAWKGRAPLPTTWSIGLELIGLYWHFVDIVWLFLYPLLYLVGSYGGAR